jgi:hypothetical protein
MKVVCPMAWERLESTAHKDVRHCAQCDRDVYFCRTDAETLEHARAGRCIARERPAASELPRMVLGRTVVVPADEQEEAATLERRERRIDRVLARPLEGERACPSCGYPVPGFRVTCFVCETKLGR